MILWAGHYTDVAVGGVRIVYGQHHDRSLVTAGQLAHGLEADQHNNDHDEFFIWQKNMYNSKKNTPQKATILLTMHTSLPE